MNIRLTARARRDFADLAPDLKSRVRKQFDSCKKTFVTHRSGQRSTTRPTRCGKAASTAATDFIFQIARDEYVIIRIIPHPK